MNTQIMALNQHNGVDTPHLAGMIMGSRGGNNGYRVKYNKFDDGCHPNSDIIKKWEKTLLDVAATNRANLPAVPIRTDNQ